jgi:hypothetical protein
VARINGVPEDFEDLLEDLLQAARSRDGARIREAFRRLVPTYKPYVPGKTIVG